MAQKAKFRVIIKANGDAVVRPPSDTAEKGNSKAVWFRNMTAAPIHVQVPPGVFTSPKTVHVIPAFDTLPAGSDSIELTVVAGVKGVYSFRVFCEETFSFAQGNSDPEFIIEN